MARVSIVNTMTAAGSVVGPDTNSNAINVKAIRDARIYVDVTAFPGTTLDVFVQIAEENVGASFVQSKAFNQITGTGRFVLALEEHELSAYVRLNYVAVGGNPTLGAKIEGKEGV